MILQHPTEDGTDHDRRAGRPGIPMIGYGWFLTTRNQKVGHVERMFRNIMGMIAIDTVPYGKERVRVLQKKVFRL
jgi:hypothetical protein